MRKILIGLIAATAVLSGATRAQAQAVITYVSNTGNDASSCSSPGMACRNLPAAVAKNVGNGTVIVLTPGAYCGGTIDKSVTILGHAPGTAVVPCGSDAGLIVSAPKSVVTIRGLTIDLRGSNSLNDIGITFAAGAVLRVEDCLIRGTVTGIDFTAAGGELYVSNCTIADSRSNSVLIEPAGGRTVVSLDRVRIQSGVLEGLVVKGGGAGTSVSVTMRDSSVSGGLTDAISVQAPGAGTVTMMIDRSVVANNSFAGIRATGANLHLRIKDSTVTGNGGGLLAAGGAAVENYPSNTIFGNSDDSLSQL